MPWALAQAADVPPPLPPTQAASALADAKGRFQDGVNATKQLRYDEAIQIFTALTRDNPSLPEPYNNLAVLYATQGDMQKAAHMLERSIQVNPNYAAAHANLGDLYARMAHEAYTKALHIDRSRSDLPPKLALVQQLFASSGQNTSPVAAPVATSAPARTPAPAAATPAESPVQAALPTPAVTAIPAAEAAATKQTATAAAAPATDSSSANQPEAAQAVETAITAWASKNLPDYFAAYSDKFSPIKGDLSSRKAERRVRIEGKNSIQLDISDLKIQVYGNRATAQFRQEYSADGFQSNDRKTLQLQREGDSWRITREFTS